MALRSFQAGDEPAWAALLQANGELGVWDVARVERELAGDLIQAAQFFVIAAGQLVATTGVYARLRLDGPAYEIGWVAVAPAWRGRGLGRQVVAAAVGAALALPSRPVYLLTDDHRLPALKLYLRLGFRPDMSHPSYRGRWRRLAHTVGEAARAPSLDRDGALAAAAVAGDRRNR
jgi:mycothiol synthase